MMISGQLRQKKKKKCLPDPISKEKKLGVVVHIPVILAMAGSIK
jgi:BarA-like signal transduction histidine kinase